MHTITSPATPAAQPAGITVSTTITAGCSGNNHSEGVVVQTSLKAGGIVVPQ